MVKFFDMLNTPRAVAVALAFFLFVDGFLLHRYQKQFEGHNSTATVIDAEPVAAEEPSAFLQQEPNISKMAATTVEEQVSATEEESVVSQDAAPLPEEEEGVADVVRVVVSVSGAPSQLRVQEDRQIVLDQVSEPGFSREFVADRAVSIRAGNAGAVRVEVDGRDLGFFGAIGEDTTRTYSAQKGTKASE